MSSIRAEEPAETPKKNNRISDEDTLKFLTLCIKHSDICKVRFVIWENHQKLSVSPDQLGSCC